MENAVKSASIYVKHAKRNSISVEDIKRALMLEVFFMKQRPNMLEQCEKIKKMLKKFKMKMKMNLMMKSYMKMTKMNLRTVSVNVSCVDA